MNCWKVKIKTTGALKDTGYRPIKPGDDSYKYIPCEHGLIFVFCDSPSEIEKVVKADTVLSIELMGIGYIAE